MQTVIISIIDFVKVNIPAIVVSGISIIITVCACEFMNREDIKKTTKDKSLGK